MAAILSIITQLLPFLSKLIGTPYVNLIASITGAVDALWTAYKAGNVTNDVMVTLQELVTVLQSVEANTGADQGTIDMALELAGIVTAAITGLNQAEAGVDPAELPVPPPVV